MLSFDVYVNKLIIEKMIDELNTKAGSREKTEKVQKEQKAEKTVKQDKAEKSTKNTK